MKDTDTHLLIPIDTLSNFAITQLFGTRFEDVAIPVNLSEESIEELALNVIDEMFGTNIRMNGIRPELRDLCIKFAKDLLNTK